MITTNTAVDYLYGVMCKGEYILLGEKERIERGFVKKEVDAWILKATHGTCYAICDENPDFNIETKDLIDKISQFSEYISVKMFDVLIRKAVASMILHAKVGHRLIYG